ncbi:MAG: hypothetical protein FWD82_08285 [Defluviitaleaceae bacterium]|nr:hypothetical protein [Defluviitaleaceae bacterium]
MKKANVKIMTYDRGSEWRKWDLQVHTPASALNNQFGGNWDNYVKTLFTKAISQEIAVIGITDYFSIEGYKKIKMEYLADENKLKVLFAEQIKTDALFLDKVRAIKLLPNIEFRFKDIVVGGGEHKIEGHIILSDEVSIDDIENKFFANIKFVDTLSMTTTDKSPLTRVNIEDFGKRMKATQLTFTESDYVVGLKCLVIDFDDIITTLQAAAFIDKYIVLIPEDDITNINWASGAHQIRKKYYIKANGLFSTNDKTIEWGLKEETKNEFESYKPCFSYSDAHSIDGADGLFKFRSNKPCWIKADPTFAGLMQVFFQPRERIFIGAKPPKIEKVEREKYHYLERVCIKKNDTAKQPVTWFNVDIPLNSGLIAIIGNKGSGKSALADILGYLVDSNNIEHASFLTNQRFRKEDKKFANDYLAQLLWKDGRTVSKVTLSEPKVDVQTAEYLPQKHIDALCNDLKNDGFQKEIDNVIFSYIDIAEKMEMTSLEDLLTKKTKDIETHIKTYKNKIETLVKKIISIEKKLTTKYKKDLEDTLSRQKKFLESHKKTKPAEVQKPSAVNSNTATEELEALNKKLADVEKRITEKRSEILVLNFKIDEIEQFISKFEFLQGQVAELATEAKKLAKDNKIKEKIDIKLEGKIQLFKDLLAQYKQKKVELQNCIEEHSDVETDASQQLLYVEKRSIEEEISKKLVAANEEDVKYQKYLLDLKKWEDSKAAIIGGATVEGTIKFCEAELEYIKTNAFSELAACEKALLENTKAIYDLYLKKIDVYKALYAPIEAKLKNILKDNSDKIEFETILKLSKDFNATFLGYVNQRVDSPYKGKAEGASVIEKIVRECDFNTWEGFELFVKRIQSSISEDKDKIEKLLTNVEACYNFVAKLEYLSVKFSLKMENKTLEELSPGQRGNVLLVFYLALSRKSEPIIIDQPEDNLDNQSVYNKLVPCILEAKKNRQVIIVTHNPNIAVACDAEQIICSSIDKITNAITYVSGSIENPEVKKNVIDILEGTMPAFELRRVKYLDH